MSSDVEPVVNGRPLSELKVVELKEELEKHGLSKIGNKTVLYNRLKKLLVGGSAVAAGDTGSESDADVPKRELASPVTNPLVAEYLAKQQTALLAAKKDAEAARRGASGDETSPPEEKVVTRRGRRKKGSESSKPNDSEDRERVSFMTRSRARSQNEHAEATPERSTNGRNDANFNSPQSGDAEVLEDELNLKSTEEDKKQVLPKEQSVELQQRSEEANAEENIVEDVEDKQASGEVKAEGEEEKASEKEEVVKVDQPSEAAEEGSSEQQDEANEKAESDVKVSAKKAADKNSKALPDESSVVLEERSEGTGEEEAGEQQIIAEEQPDDNETEMKTKMLENAKREETPIELEKLSEATEVGTSEQQDEDKEQAENEAQMDVKETIEEKMEVVGKKPEAEQQPSSDTTGEGTSAKQSEDIDHVGIEIKENMEAEAKGDPKLLPKDSSTQLKQPLEKMVTTEFQSAGDEQTLSSSEADVEKNVEKELVRIAKDTAIELEEPLEMGNAETEKQRSYEKEEAANSTEGNVSRPEKDKVMLSSKDQSVELQQPGESAKKGFNQADRPDESEASLDAGKENMWSQEPAVELDQPTETIDEETVQTGECEQAEDGIELDVERTEKEKEKTLQDKRGETENREKADEGTGDEKEEKVASKESSVELEQHTEVMDAGTGEQQREENQQVNVGLTTSSEKLCDEKEKVSGQEPSVELQQSSELTNEGSSETNAGNGEGSACELKQDEDGVYVKVDMELPLKLEQSSVEPKEKVCDLEGGDGQLDEAETEIDIQKPAGEERTLPKEPTLELEQSCGETSEGERELRSDRGSEKPADVTIGVEMPAEAKDEKLARSVELQSGAEASEQPAEPVNRNVKATDDQSSIELEQPAQELKEPIEGEQNLEERSESVETSEEFIAKPEQAAVALEPVSQELEQSTKELEYSSEDVEQPSAEHESDESIQVNLSDANEVDDQEGDSSMDVVAGDEEKSVTNADTEDEGRAADKEQADEAAVQTSGDLQRPHSIAEVEPITDSSALLDEETSLDYEGEAKSDEEESERADVLAASTSTAAEKATEEEETSAVGEKHSLAGASKSPVRDAGLQARCTTGSETNECEGESCRKAKKRRWKHTSKTSGSSDEGVVTVRVPGESDTLLIPVPDLEEPMASEEELGNGGETHDESVGEANVEPKDNPEELDYEELVQHSHSADETAKSSLEADEAPPSKSRKLASDRRTSSLSRAGGRDRSEEGHRRGHFVDVSDSDEKHLTVDGLVRRQAVSPARYPVTKVLMIRQLTRPFTVKQLQQLLGTFGTIAENGFWIDGIKSTCIVKYSTKEEAVVARGRLHNVVWPASNPRALKVDFLDEAGLTRHLEEGKEVKPAEVEKRKSTDSTVTQKQSTLRVSLVVDRGSRVVRPQSPEERREKASQVIRVANTSKRERGYDRVSPSREDAGKRMRSPEQRRSEPEKNVKTADELFRKTKTQPAIYYMPLTEAQVAERMRRKSEVIAEISNAKKVTQMEAVIVPGGMQRAERVDGAGEKPLKREHPRSPETSRKRRPSRSRSPHRRR